MNQKMHIGGIFCNLANASDYVNHEILLSKLNLYGIQGVLRVTTFLLCMFLNERCSNINPVIL
jgi:hypothetical protein